MAGGSGDLRLFFAVVLPEELRDRACELQRELVGVGAKVKWVERPNLHMTLKFIGATPRERLETCREVAEQVAEGASRCELTLRGAGCFSSRGALRTIWLGVEGDAPELGELAVSLDAALVEGGLAEPEKRKFSPHFTLGRVKGRHHARELLAAVESLSGALVGTMVVDHLVLMNSELRPGGPTYSEEAAFSLGGPTSGIGHPTSD